MGITAPELATGAGPRAVDGTRAIRGWPPPVIVVLGTCLSLIGISWDSQWHRDVGPDTFFTMPHLFLYAGSAIVGLTSLFVVLMTTVALRAGRTVDARIGGQAVPMFGRMFAAPVGYLVSGTGAASFLLYGLWDQWWHSLYGFDAVLDSPPHIGLLLSVTISMTGCVMVFGAARPSRWSLPGCAIGSGVLLAFSVLTTLGLDAFSGVVDAVAVGMAFLVTVVLVTNASFARRGWAILSVAVALSACQAFLWWFSPLATVVYADAIGLPMRDYVDGSAVMPALMPMGIIPIAVVLEIILWVGRRRSWPASVLATTIGACAGILITVARPIQGMFVYLAPMPDAIILISTGFAGALVGILAAFCGQRFGLMLRHLAPRPEKVES